MLTHYQMLEVSRFADLGEIRKAYHRISLLHHPDKTIHLPESERAQREQLFKLANAAFEDLSDPKKRKAYDQRILRSMQGQRYGPAQDCQSSNNRDQTSAHPAEAYPGESESFQSSQSVQRTPSSAHRFTASTLGEAPAFHWYHCQLNEYSKRTALTYNNWLGWNFSLNVASHFKVLAKPVIPHHPVREAVIIRLPLLRKVGNMPHTLKDVVIELRGAPGNKHTILCSALVESQAAGLEVVVELALAPEAVQTIAQGPAKWTWAYNIDHEPLATTLMAKVTNSLFYPYKPSYAVLARGGTPTPPYPEESPMHGLLTRFPGMKIKETGSDTYCVEEEQQGKIMWRLTAMGSM